MTPSPENSLTPWTSAWYEYQKSALGESACRQLGFYVIPEEIIVSIVIPFFNEQQTLETIVNKVAAIPIAKEIILVDDGSTDGSPAIARSLAEKFNRPDDVREINQIRIETHKTNLGKGTALRTGFKSATGDIVIVQDADLEYDPDDIPRLIQPIIEQKADVVFGSRFLGDSQRAGQQAGYFWNYVGNRFLTTLSNVFTNLKLSDIETGYKAFTREVIDAIAPSLVSKRFDFEPEITARIAREKVRVYEVPISYTGRTYAEGKKIRWYDGLEAIWSIVRFGLFN
jgi:glycosyltransferase involved in cell wall biosynthesis